MYLYLIIAYAGIMFSVKFILDEELFYAERIQDAISGIGTDEQQLSRIIVGRCEVNLSLPVYL